MPTGRERTPNKPLSGLELRTILRDYFEKLLDAEGLLSSHLAYGRIAGKLTLTLQVDNAFAPSSTTEVKVRPAGVNVVERQPELGALEEFPLASPSEDAAASQHTADFRVTSPNAERVRHGLPVPVEIRQQDSTMRTEKVIYPRDAAMGDGDVQVRDTTAESGLPGTGVAPPRGGTPLHEASDEEAAKVAAPAETRDFWGARAERDPKAPWPTTEPS